MARIRETLPGSTWNEEFSAKRIASQVGHGGTATVAAQIVAQRLEQKISKNAPYDTGELSESVKARIILGGNDPRVNVKTVVHGAYQEHGTTVLPPTHFMSEIVRGDRAAWEADIKATKATLDKRVAAAEKKEKGRDR